MKKLLFLIALLSVLLLSGCTEYVKEFKEEEKSWGTEYTFHQVSPEGLYTFYTLLVPDFYKTPTLYKKTQTEKWNLDNMKVESFENVTINSIVRENGKITSLTVNNQKYQLLK